jgi:hypothetical protein
MLGYERHDPSHPHRGGAVTYAIIQGPAGAYVDVDGNPNAAECVAVAAAGYVGLIGYVPFAGLHDTSSCVTRATIDNAHAAGLVCFFVQHVRLPNWNPANCSGAADGLAAMAWLHSIDPALCDATVAQDIEEVAGTASHTFTFAIGFGANVNAPALYDGDRNPMSAKQKYDLPRVKVYWNAPGVRSVAKRGYLIQQGYPPVTIAGRSYDVDIVRAADELGENNLRVAARVSSPNA